MEQVNPNMNENKIILEPFIGACLSNAWYQIPKYFLELLLIFILAFAISLPGYILWGAFEDHSFLYPLFGFLGFIYWLIISIPLDYSVSFAFLKAVRNEKVEAKDIMLGYQTWLNCVSASVLSMAIVAIGLVLLIIPGIIFSCKLAFVPFLVMDKKMDAVEAVKTSWKMTDGHALKIFGMFLLSIPIVLLGILCLVVGIIPAIMWVELAFAYLYFSVSEYEKQQFEAQSV
ncbi:hypothetical protein ACFLSQ_08610 [Bacteroidota bacterium]